MKTVSIVLSIISLILMASTLICGFWIRSHTAIGAPADASSVTFHMQIAVASAISVLATLGVFLFAR